MNHISSYGSIYALGHRTIRDMFESEVYVEEKVDGSQFSFGILDGELCARSKGKDIILDAPEKMFLKAIEIIRELPLTPGWIYRGEYLQSPKHNSLAYSRIPKNHIILFDVEKPPQNHLMYEEKAEDAALPECTKEEMWETDTTYVVKKNGGKTAQRGTAKLTSLEDAEKWIMENIEEKERKKFTTEKRPGERKRCAKWCDVAPFCNQYKEYKARNAA